MGLGLLKPDFLVFLTCNQVRCGLGYSQRERLWQRRTFLRSKMKLSTRLRGCTLELGNWYENECLLKGVELLPGKPCNQKADETVQIT